MPESRVAATGGDGSLERADPRDRFTLQAQREFRTSIRPVYRNSASSPRPEHIGSCLLLSIEGVPTIVTAAHLLRQVVQYSLYVGGLPGAGLVHIAGGSSMATSGERADHFDIAMWQPLPSAVDGLGGIDFLNASRISPNREPSQDRLYTALGYAVSRNKKAIDHATSSISTHVSMYTAESKEMPRLASKLGVSGSDHLFLSFEKHSFTGDGKRVNTFGPIGLSGGALLDLGEFGSPESYARDPSRNAMLAGMIIEYYRAESALVAVRIDAAIRVIRNALARRLSKSSA
jgi:hypothetical protein